MVGKLFRRKRDKAIIHKSVPEEVLFPDGRRNSEADTSWMDAVLPEAKAAPATPSRQASNVSPKSAPRVQKAGAESEIASPPKAVPISFPDGRSNPASEGRPKYPVGWLVAIEGESAGEWAPLEVGISSLGPEEAATITSRTGKAAIAFVEAENIFVVSSDGGQGVRLNGLLIGEPTRLRDGDVIGLGETAYKLVALCNGNFRWNSST